MSNSISLGDLFGDIPDEPKKQAKATKHSVSTWTYHKCESKHRSGESFLKCASKWTHNGEKLTKNSRNFFGTGEWAVVHSHYSDDYYTVHNNKKLNHGHFIDNMYMFKTYEEACKYLDSRREARCFEGKCTGNCWGLEGTIIHVSL